MNSETDKHSEDNLLIIKVRFKSQESNIFGQMIILLNNNKEFESFNSVVSTYSDVYKAELNSDWDKYEEMIADLKWKGQYNNNMTASLMSQITNFSIDRKILSQFYDFVYNYDYKNMELILYDQFNRVLHEKNLSIETLIQEITPDEFNEIKLKRSKPKDAQEKNSNENKEETSVQSTKIIPIDLILSPVKGKPIYNIKIGDKVMVKIKPNNDKSNYVIDDFGLRKNKEILAIPAEIIDIKAGTDRKDPIEILTKIAPGIYGKGYENEKGVKLKIYDPTVDEDLTQKKIKITKDKLERTDYTEKIPIISKGTFVMAVLLLIILTLFFLLLYIKW